MDQTEASPILRPLRTYDVWGAVRLGAQTGDPKGRYCASLGHKQDDESGLVYMRARYYEPTSGRFVNQDPGRNGLNWFSYAGDDPVSNVDASGKYYVNPNSESQFYYIMGEVAGGVFSAAAFFAFIKDLPMCVACLEVACLGWVMALGQTTMATNLTGRIDMLELVAAVGPVIYACAVGMEALESSPYTACLAACLGSYDMMLAAGIYCTIDPVPPGASQDSDD